MVSLSKQHSYLLSHSCLSRFFLREILAKIEIHNLADDAFFLLRCIAWRFLRIFWYFQTALLCSLKVLENLLLPSPRATKYRYLFSAGYSTLCNDARPGLEIGVGGSPYRLYVL